MLCHYINEGGVLLTKDALISSIDIGTAYIRAVIAELREDGEVDILGIGETPSHGVRKGAIVNIDAASQALSEAVEAAEVMAGVEVANVVVGLGGDHVQSINSKGVVGIQSKNREITPFEIERVLESARSVRLPVEKEIIHAIPQEYAIDEQDGIKNPIGMAGTRLEAEVHVITGVRTSIDNLLKVVKKSGFGLADLIVNPLAAAEAVLTEGEKELGIVVVDIGKATTGVEVFVEGAVWHTAVLPIGSEYITNDIAMGLKMPANAAEETKRNYGCAHLPLVGEHEVIEIPSVGERAPRTIQKRALAEIIEPRVEELFRFVLKELRNAKCDDILTAGAVLTGGAASLDGMPEVAESVFGNMAARIGYPKGFNGMVDITQKPGFAAAVGLVLTTAHEAMQTGKLPKKGAKAGGPGGFSKLRDWLGEFFS